MEIDLKTRIIDDLKHYSEIEDITGNILTSSLLIYGSNCGQCNSCNSACLHPLSTADLILFFQKYHLKLIDWLDNKKCVLRFPTDQIMQDVLSTIFQHIYTTHNSVDWYMSNNPVYKQLLTDIYGERGQFVYIFARLAYSSDQPIRPNRKKFKKSNKQQRYDKRINKSNDSSMNAEKNISSNINSSQTNTDTNMISNDISQVNTNSNILLSDKSQTQTLDTNQNYQESDSCISTQVETKKQMNQKIKRKKTHADKKHKQSTHFKKEKAYKSKMSMKYIGQHLFSDLGSSVFSFNMFNTQSSSNSLSNPSQNFTETDISNNSMIHSDNNNNNKSLSMNTIENQLKSNLEDVNTNKQNTQISKDIDLQLQDMTISN